MNRYFEADELDACQKIELEILAYVQNFCQLHNIRFFVAYGTLIGAVRHDGFIPWDDDIDLCMLRDDYFKFIELWQETTHPHYVLQNVETEILCPFGFSKVRRNHTAFIEKEVLNIPMHHGVFVDIFPLVPTSNRMWQARWHHFRGRILTHLLIGKSINDVSREVVSAKDYLSLAIRKTLHFVLKPVPKLCIYQRLLKWMKTYDEQSGLYLDMTAQFNLIKLDEMFPTRVHQFEHLEVPIPNQAHEMLTHYYGDYMALPPENQRYGHRPVKLDVGEYM